MKNKNKILILNEDFECLKWLWRWKLLSTRGLKLGVYKTKSLNRAYRRLLQLEKEKLIQSYWSRDGKYCLWLLSEKGFELLKNNYPAQFLNGYKTENPNHDFWTTAIHLGDWAAEKPKESLIFTEQELRRHEIEHYPGWVPHTRQHRPDGYWKINLSLKNSESLVALEVELSKKEPYRYKSAGEFYHEIIEIYQVLWVVKSEGDINYIFKHLTDGKKEYGAVHSFTTIDQYMRLGWQSQIIFGKNCGKTISDFLQPRGVPSLSDRPALGLLDLRKRPMDSTTHNPILGADLGLNRHIIKSKDSYTAEYKEPGVSYDT